MAVYSIAPNSVIVTYIVYVQNVLQNIRMTKYREVKKNGIKFNNLKLVRKLKQIEKFDSSQIFVVISDKIIFGKFFGKEDNFW